MSSVTGKGDIDGILGCGLICIIMVLMPCVRPFLHSLPVSLSLAELTDPARRVETNANLSRNDT